MSCREQVERSETHHFVLNECVANEIKRIELKNQSMVGFAIALPTLRSL
jgi:hypothetical protein